MKRADRGRVLRSFWFGVAKGNYCLSVGLVGSGVWGDYEDWYACRAVLIAISRWTLTDCLAVNLQVGWLCYSDLLFLRADAVQIDARLTLHL